MPPQQHLDEAIALAHTDMHKAEKLVEDAIQADATAWQAYLVKAFLCSRQQKHAVAIQSLKIAKHLNPNNPDIYFNLGYCSMELGDFVNAKHYFLDCLNHSNNKNTNAMILFIHCALQIGEHQQALSFAEKYHLSRNNNVVVVFYLCKLFACTNSSSLPPMLERLAELLIKQENADSLTAFIAQYDDFQWQQLDNKASLHRLIDAYRKKAKENQFSAFPMVFVLPEDYDKLTKHHEQNKNLTWIVKPETLNCGQGTYLTQDVTIIKNQPGWIVQHYVDNPLLINQCKFNLRLYLLVTCPNPFEAYLWHNGVVFVAPESYALDAKAVHDVAKHIVNPFYCRKHPNMKMARTAAEDGEGNIWSLQRLLQYFAEQDIDVENVLTRLRELCFKLGETVIANQLFEPQQAATASSPKLLGMDVMLDADLNAHLLEVERFPGLSTPENDVISLHVKKHLRHDVALSCLQCLSQQALDPDCWITIPVPPEALSSVC